ncbi:MAG: phosphoglucosamine mutase [Thaumarchaeota archaeon]|nr:phosphoglucosamine mutase [Nitrososphaerota archaeon]MCL5317741.1 phosphoglucosamine mutase [Nitrososphaerota archaeon]
MATNRKRLFGTSGIRGIPGQDLTLDFVTEMAQAVGTFFEKGPILVGHDTRHSGPTLAKAVAAGLMSVGLDVGEAGLLPTPALQYYVRNMEYNGGVMITASHNPSQYNGMKVSGSDGIDTTRDEEQIIENIYYDKEFRLADWKTVGSSFQDTKTIRAYSEGILSQVNVDQIRNRNFRVVVDPGNGAQCVAAPYILERLNCKPISLNAQPDGDFPGRGAEPTPDVLKGLSEAVKTYGADMGVAYDGDGDRSLFCDEKGVVHYGDRSAALLTDYILTQNPGALIVTTVSASKAIDDIVEARSGRIFKTKVGSVDVSNAMVERKALFGLEENGGCFYAPHIPVRDGAMTSALILEAMSKSSKPLSEILNSLPNYQQRKTKFECAREKVPKVMEQISAHAKGKVETIDGLKLWIDDKTWILIRPSGTEPVLRVFAESDRKDKLDTMINEYSEVVKDVLKRTTSS